MALITPLQGALSLYSTVLHPSNTPEAICPHRLFAPLTSPLPVIRPAANTSSSKASSHLVKLLDLPLEMQLKGQSVFLMQELDCGLERLGQAVMTLGRVWPDVGSRGAFGIRGAFPVCLQGREGRTGQTAYMSSFDSFCMRQNTPCIPTLAQRLGRRHSTYSLVLESGMLNGKQKKALRGQIGGHLWSR